MDKSRYITNETIERANNYMIKRGINSKNAFDSLTNTFHVSVKYLGKTISQQISLDQLNKEFAKSLEAAGYGQKL